MPVPEAQDVRGDAIRHEVKLPVTIPASCTDENLTVKKLPDRCPPLETLRAFLGMHQGRIASVEGRVFTVDGDLWKLMQALTDKNALSAKPFPENAKILPDEVRRLRTWGAVDSRDATPPQAPHMGRGGLAGCDAASGTDDGSIRLPRVLVDVLEERAPRGAATRLARGHPIFQYPDCLPRISRAHSDKPVSRC